MGQVKNHLGIKDKLAIFDFLREGIIEAVDGGLFCYTAGWADKKVAEALSVKLGKPVTISNVASVRLELFGALAPRGGLSAEAELRKTVDALQERVEALEKVVFRGAETLL